MSHAEQSSYLSQVQSMMSHSAGQQSGAGGLQGVDFTVPAADISKLGGLLKDWQAHNFNDFSAFLKEQSGVLNAIFGNTASHNWLGDINVSGGIWTIGHQPETMLNRTVGGILASTKQQQQGH